MRIEDSVISDDFITAKVRGMRSRMFEAERLIALGEVRFLPDLFKRIGFSESFEGIRQFERELAARNLADLVRIRNYLSGAALEVYQALLIRFHVENLKVVIRAHLARVDAAAAERSLLPLPKDLAIPDGLLQENPDLRKFLRQLPVPELAVVVAEHLRLGDRLDPVDFEMDLDAAYWRLLLAAARRNGLRSLLLVQHDCAIGNLMLILRARFNWEMPYDKVVDRIVPDGRSLDANRCRRIYMSQEFQDALARIPASLLPREIARSVSSLTALEDALLLQHYRFAARIFTKSVLDLSVVVAFFYLKRAELANLIHLSEGVRHGMSREEIESRLLTTAR